MEDISKEIEKLVCGFQLTSEIAQLQDKISNLRRWIKKVCGNCDKWMDSYNCPYETNVDGRKKGPSMNECACNLFCNRSLDIKYYNKECQELLDDKHMKYIPEYQRPKLIEIKEQTNGK